MGLSIGSGHRAIATSSDHIVDNSLTIEAGATQMPAGPRDKSGGRAL
jgi:hypothetical protein